MSDQPENTPGAPFPDTTLGADTEAPPPEPHQVEAPTKGDNPKQADIPTDVPKIPKGENDKG